LRTDCVENKHPANLNLNQIFSTILKALDSSLLLDPSRLDHSLEENKSAFDHQTISASDKTTYDTLNSLISGANLQEGLKSINHYYNREAIGAKWV